MAGGALERELKPLPGKLANSVSTVVTDFKMQKYDADVQLMLRVKNGDSTAFAQLVELYEHRLQNFLFRKLNNRNTAEELTQDVFLRVYRARAGYEPSASLSTWIFTIAGNLCRNEIRRRTRRPEVILSQLSKDDRSTADYRVSRPTQEQDASLNETRVRIEDAMGQLTDRQRQAFGMCCFDGKPYDVIATSLKSSRSAVKGLLHRARETLRANLTCLQQS